ncbi:putative entry exclusion protein TrbK-alt [Sphingomonas sp. PB4P5]|uniref:putative entry exclusion protein TrbK-alt n=1 Tax=Parasphingomonas puruogangriensis TaxID=3096155 RepID=UPI002FC71E68
MDLRIPARIGAFACLGVALAMGLLALREEPRTSSPLDTFSTVPPVDPLQAKLRRCQLAGQMAGSDQGCLAAWAENRQRFLGQQPRRPEAPDLPGGGGDKISEPAIVANEAVANFQQEQ